MNIRARVLADSISPLGRRLTTLELIYPRFIHAEFMTHRVFSRNASSSRAIPVNRMISMTLADPAFFAFVGKNRPGMQAVEAVEPVIQDQFHAEWLELMRISASYVRRWADDYGIHKQTANRALEPWQLIKVVVSSTEWDNFFELRDHTDAQPEIRVLAQVGRRALDDSVPRLLYPGDWHLPYILDRERDEFDLETLRQISTARCARTSYNAHDGKPSDPFKDVDLFDRLVGARPLHASPAEHQATPDEPRFFLPKLFGQYKNPKLHGNLQGWVQHRKLIEQSIWSAQ